MTWKIMPRHVWVLAASSVLMPLAPASALVSISDAPTQNVSCVSGVCTPTAQRANLNTTDLAGMLASSSVTLNSGASALDINIASAFSWTSANTLTLDAARNVQFKAQVTAAGPGGVTILTNDGGSGGDLRFTPDGALNFWDLSSSLTVNGDAYTLVDTLPSLISAIHADRGGFFALTKDYNAFKVRVFSSSPISSFAGKLEGLGHTISNLAVTAEKQRRRPYFTGMIGTSTGTIRDIGLKNEAVESLFYAGGLVGENDGTIDGVHTTGSVTTDSNYSVYYSTGGIVSYNTGTVENSWSSAAVNSPYAGGGLVGYNSGAVANSYANGPVANDYFYSYSQGGGGGLVGYNSASGTITRSYAQGAVSGFDPVGGLVGENLGTVTLSHSSGTASGNAAGGFVGSNGGTISFSYSSGDAGGSISGGFAGLGGAFFACYATGASNTGGFVGEYSGGGIAQAYSTGTLQGSYYDVGGFVGIDGKPGTLTSVYWDTDLSGILNLGEGAGNIPFDAGIEGLSTAQMQGHLPPGFDPGMWARKAGVNNGLPYLRANPPAR
jgi:hypothetical protein